jgi:hypothetical protein
LSDHHSQKIENDSDALAYLHKSKGHLILYGGVKSRQHNGKTCYVLSFRELVIHKPITRESSEQLSRDIGIPLPSMVQFPEDLEIVGFAYTKEILSMAARWAIGISRLFSGDPYNSFAIHLQLFREIQQTPEDTNYRDLLMKLRNRLIYFLMLSGMESLTLVYLKKNLVTLKK